MEIKTHPPKNESSLIKELGYDADSETLAVQFHNGDIWHYSPISPAEFHQMAQSDSAGKYFHAHIKGKKAGAKQ